MTNENILPIAPLRGFVLFPGTTVSFDAVRPFTVAAAEKALEGDRNILLFTQSNLFAQKLTDRDLYNIGCIAKVKQFARTDARSARVMVEIKQRVRLTGLLKTKPFFAGEYELIEEEITEENVISQAYMRSLQDSFDDYLNVVKIPFNEKLASIFAASELGELTDAIASNIECSFVKKQELLETFDVFERVEKVLELLKTEAEILKTKKYIDDEVKKKIDDNQREYYLREELNVIEKELGDKDGFSEEIAAYRKKIRAIGFSEKTEEKLLKDTERLSKSPSASPDNSVLRSYLDTVLELPWNIYTEDSKDIANAEAILNKTHYGMDDVKQRVLEQLAVHALTGGGDGTVLCLAGPPGTGKTSIAASVAEALGRKFVRISLGGVHDEAEIRGHRKTYIGSMPGRIISAVKQSGTMNPVILLDEIDKLGNDYKGDPSSALLEVLDFEQNHSFRDNYLEIPFDLSKVMFIATANNLSNIPAPLYDRVEITEIPGYTNPAKFEIAKNYLIPKQLEKNGLKGKKVTFTDGAVYAVINHYTREAGVRELERKIAAALRKAARVILSGEKVSAKITENNITKYLGKKKFFYDEKNTADEVGTVRGLAWTAAGGDTLSIEVNVMSGTGKIEITGNLGDVMKESAMTAVSYVRSKAEKLKIKNDFYKTKDIHIHVPEGAVPKDGPSAGITIATAVASALTDTPVRCDVAMTGEITLRGNVLPIGGLREKSLAAYRAGIKTVVIPDKNRQDIDDIPEPVREQLKFVPVTNMESVLKTAFAKA